ncbi:MAG: histidine--tRNA ligase, partial [Gammaproteobacteria bacterium]|nr:histidine--tRNA ligase [Gammaproteobacteria bacterium]
MSRLQAIRGMNDILPDQSPLWRHIEDAFRATAEAFGYREIRFPLLEQTRLFRRSIGEVTDIVEKEMYSFADSGGDDISLRPEGTAGCVRAARQHGLLHNRQQRLWYQGPMFRRERPQKGRYRQFHQFGVEAFGMAGPDIDAEIIELSQALWRRLGLAGALTLELNNIGSAEDRKRYSAVLSEYLAARAEEIDPAARARIHSNPLRVLDSKHPGTREVAQEAPVLASHLSPESVAHYTALKGLLKAAGIRHVENPALVRGLDYYNYCVFEWTTDALGAQGAVCGGGRYDGLVAQLGGRPSPAAGFAIGV